MMFFGIVGTALEGKQKVGRRRRVPEEWHFNEELEGHPQIWWLNIHGKKNIWDAQLQLAPEEENYERRQSEVPMEMGE
jgi:hypothetical protein